MKRALWTIDQMFGRKLARHTERHLADVASAPVRASRERTMSLLHSLETRGDGPRVLLGQTTWHKPAEVPLAYLVNAHAIMTGGTGSGKTMAALLLIDAILRSPESDIAFAVLDPKGELFTRTLYLVARRLEELPPRQAEALVRRIVIVDLSSPDPLTSYNIASPWAGCDLVFFADSRVDTFRELLPA